MNSNNKRDSYTKIIDKILLNFVGKAYIDEIKLKDIIEVEAKRVLGNDIDRNFAVKMLKGLIVARLIYKVPNLNSYALTIRGNICVYPDQNIIYAFSVLQI